MSEQLSNAVIQAVLLTKDEQRIRSALSILRGEVSPDAAAHSGPLLLGMSKAAQFLGISRTSMWRLIRAGKFKRIELFPGNFRVRRADLERFTQDGAV
ncbi:MAG: helix-turn-helix domain-containing protein [Lentisphaerota bacterium]